MINPEKNAEFRKKLSDGYDVQYMAMLSDVPNFIKNNVNPKTSVTKDRFVYNAQILKYLLPIAEAAYNCTVFKVTRKAYDKKSVADSKKRGGGMFGDGVDRNHDSTTCVYAYIYTNNKDEPKYFCYGPTFRSQDGEYRGRFLPFAQLEKIEKRFEKQLEQVEELIVEKMRNRELEFHADFCFTHDYPNDIRSFQDKIDNRRLVIRLYSLCWLCDFRRIYMRNAENHINPAYQHIIFDKNDIPIYNTIAKLTDNIQRDVDILMQAYVFDLNCAENFSHVPLPIFTGQKIIPMTLREASSINDERFPSWRELRMTLDCADMVANLISPSFPMVNNWFYIQNANAGVFDNFAQYEKYAQSKLATQIGESLKDADRMTYLNYKSSEDHRKKKVKSKKGGFESPQDTGDYGGIIAETIVSNKKPYENFKFEEYSRKINGAILYGESTIKLSDALLCMHVEQVGRTFRDIAPIVISLDDRAPGGYKAIFTRMETFGRHIFDAIYAFYCMNVKLLMMHSDAHLNNLTIFKQVNFFNKDGTVIEKLNNARIVYAVSNAESDVILDNFNEKEESPPERHYFMFEQRGLNTMIIDLSRGITANKKRLIKEHGNLFAEHYMKKQNIRLLKTIEHYFPSFYAKYKLELSIAVETKFPLMFKAMSVLDTYTVATGLVNMFVVEKELKSPPSLMKLSARMKARAEELILTNLEGIATDRIKSVKDFKWPTYLILTEIFDDFKVSENNDIIKYNGSQYVVPSPLVVSDVFSNDHEMQYSYDTYDNYPPMIQFDVEEVVGTEIFGQPKPWIEKAREEMRAAANSRDHVVEIGMEYQKEAYTPGEIDFNMASVPLSDETTL